jgi:hypothetical protein
MPEDRDLDLFAASLIERQQRELAAAIADARRYRLVRDRLCDLPGSGGKQDWHSIGRALSCLHHAIGPDAIDARIDAALSPEER